MFKKKKQPVLALYWSRSNKNPQTAVGIFTKTESFRITLDEKLSKHIADFINITINPNGVITYLAVDKELIIIPVRTITKVRIWRSTASQ